MLDGLRGTNGENKEDLLTALAQIAVKDNTTLSVNVFDAAVCVVYLSGLFVDCSQNVVAVEAALRGSWLQVVPVRDGTMLTITVPK